MDLLKPTSASAPHDHQALIDRFRPIVRYHSKEAATPCSIEYLVQGCTLVEQPYLPDGEVNWDVPGTSVMSNPTPDQLGDHPQNNMRIELSSTVYPGEGWTAPMYASVQTDPGGKFIDLNYLFLFAFNGAQTARIKIPYNDFNCILPHFAEHEGDIEGFTVRITSDTYEILFCRYEAHGDSFYFDPDDVLREGDHVIVGLALNSHATYNMKGKNDEDWMILESYEAVGFGALFIDLLPDGDPGNARRWNPSQVIEVGIDADGNPVNGQRWALFKGRLGRHGTAEYSQATGIYGGLSSYQLGLIDTLVPIVSSMGLIPTDQQGPMGLGDRTSVIKQNEPASKTTTVAVRLQQRPDLALSVNPQDLQGALIVSPYINSDEQTWSLLPLGDVFGLVNSKTGRIAYAPNDNSAVVQAAYPPTDDSGKWSSSGGALRPNRNHDQNLNVFGDDHHPRPGTVGVWGWGGGNANEMWRIDEVGSFPWPVSFGPVVVALAYRPYLLLTARADNPDVVTVEYDNGSDYQRWNQVVYWQDGNNPCYALVNVATGKALFARGGQEPVHTADPTQMADNAIWNATGYALRPIWDFDQNLNVYGDDDFPQPGSTVGVWSWGGGNPNETWALAPVTPWPPTARRVRVVCARNTNLTIQANGMSVMSQVRNDADPNQVWLRTDYFGNAFTLRHEATGRMLRFQGGNSPVFLADLNPGDMHCFWNQRDEAVRPLADDDQNLNIFGDGDNPQPGSPVGTWDWGGGDTNELWSFVNVP